MCCHSASSLPPPRTNRSTMFALASSDPSHRKHRSTMADNTVRSNLAGNSIKWSGLLLCTRNIFNGSDARSISFRMRSVRVSSNYPTDKSRSRILLRCRARVDAGTFTRGVRNRRRPLGVCIRGIKTQITSVKGVIPYAKKNHRSSGDLLLYQTLDQ